MFYPPNFLTIKAKDPPPGNGSNSVMIEIFRTNISNAQQAQMLVNEIHKTFTGYRANFDLWDCDKILRIQSATGFVQPSAVIDLLKSLGYTAELLL